MLRVTVSVFLLVGMGVAQSPSVQSEPPHFEAAAIHPTNPKEFADRSGCLTTPGFMRCSNVTLKRCIVGAYEVGSDRVLGGPAWVDTDHFQITARSKEPVGDKELMRMLQTLLTNRFKLALRRELRSGEAMVLEVAKSGPKLQPPSGARTSWKNMHDHIEATRITMGEFAGILSRELNLPVVDQTGLAGAFSFMVRWNPAEADALNRDEAIEVHRSDLAGAIARQLGLTLKHRKMPIEFLIIDHAEEPSEN